MLPKAYSIAFKTMGDRWMMQVAEEGGRWNYRVLQNGVELYTSGPEEASETELEAKQKMQRYLDRRFGRLINLLGVRWHAEG